MINGKNFICLYADENGLALLRSKVKVLENGNNINIVTKLTTTI